MPNFLIFPRRPNQINEISFIFFRIFEELKEVTKNFNHLLRNELEKREVYVAALERFVYDFLLKPRCQLN